MKRDFLLALIPATAHSHLSSISFLCGVCIVAVFSLVVFGCGGGSPRGGSLPDQPPVITSSPPSQASEGDTYSYTVSATDPQRSSVTFTLTRAPSGAALNGNTLSWTPAAEQSRVENQFEITATNAKGLSTRQNWSVSPAGTVRIKWIDTYITADGTEQRVPRDLGAGSSLYIPADNFNGYVEVPPTSVADGIATYRKVPPGHFHFEKSWMNAIWTDKSSLDMGAALYGRNIGQPSYTSTVTSTVTGVRSLGELNRLYFHVPNVRAQADLGSWMEPLDNWNSSILFVPFDHTKGDIAYIAEYAENQLLDPVLMHRSRLVAAAQSAELSVEENSKVEFTAALTPVAEDQSLTLKVRSSQWADALRQMHSRALFNDFSVGVYAHPLAAHPNLFSDGRPLLNLDHVGRNLGTLPPSDLDLGTFNYSNAFPNAWQPEFFFLANAISHFSRAGTPGVDAGAQVGYISHNIPGTADLIAPLVHPVTNIKVDGKDATAAEFTINTLAPVISWTPPQGAPRIAGYVVSLCQIAQDQFGYACWDAGSVHTTETSVKLIPFVANVCSGYANIITVRVITDPAADLATKPSFARPTGWADALTEVFYCQR